MRHGGALSTVSFWRDQAKKVVVWPYYVHPTARKMATRMSIRASLSENTARVMPEIFKHRLLQMAEETLESLQKIWNEAGYEEIERQRLLGEFLSKQKEAFAVEVNNEQQILEHAKAEVQSKCDEYASYCEQLGRHCNMKHVESMNYQDRLNEMERLIGTIAGEVSERQGLLDTELSNILALCSTLGEAAPADDAFDGPPGTPLLSDTRLNHMRQYVAELESLKAQRIEEVTALAAECWRCMEELTYAEEGFSTMQDSDVFISLDKKIDLLHRTGEFTLGLKPNDIAFLTARVQSFTEEKDKRRAELGKIGADIARLWTLLRIPSAERDKFSSSFKMNLSMETLSKGIDERQRLQEVRAQSLGKVIAGIREDIAILWGEAGIETDEARRGEFPLYFEDVSQMEDSAVDAHEAYFASLRTRVEELRPLLQKIARREAVVQERIELEHLQMNPERLTARGPNAREERKREEGMSNRVRNLEKVTKELLSQIAAWEETNGPFMYGGDRYRDRVALQEEHYIEIRDSLRNARKKKDGKDTQVAPSTTAAGRTVTAAATKRTSTVSAGNTVRATPAKHTLPPQTPLNRSASTAAANASVAALPAVPESDAHCDDDYSENNYTASNITSLASRESEGTIKTSLTQIKERPLSTDSHTVVRVPLA